MQQWRKLELATAPCGLDARSDRRSALVKAKTNISRRRDMLYGIRRDMLDKQNFTYKTEEAGSTLYGFKMR